MDTRGLVKTLLSYISDTLGWSLRSSIESSTERAMCDTCGKCQTTDGMRKVFGGICLCNPCVDHILSIHVSTSPIKVLCPFCYGKEGNSEKCMYCDLKQLPGDVTDDS